MMTHFADPIAAAMAGSVNNYGDHNQMYKILLGSSMQHFNDVDHFSEECALAIQFSRRIPKLMAAPYSNAVLQHEFGGGILHVFTLLDSRQIWASGL
jgi:hypothetical protein